MVKTHNHPWHFVAIQISLQPIYLGDLVLDSGRPSAEHVLNVLARLKEAPPPPSVETALRVSAVPLADPERYDSLRTEVSHG